MDDSVSWELVGQWERSQFQQWVGFPAVECVPAMGRFVDFARKNELDYLRGVRVVKTTEMGKTHYRVSDPSWVMQNTLYQGLVWALSKQNPILEEAMESATAMLTEFTRLIPLVGTNKLAEARQAGLDMIALVGDLADDGTRIQVPMLRNDGNFMVRRFRRTSL